MCIRDSTWTRRADPPFGDRLSQSAWGDGRLVIWGASPHTVHDPDGLVSGYDWGAGYEPGSDRWTMLPDQPTDAPITTGSPAFVGDQLIVWGSDATDATRTAGYRLRLGDRAWRTMAPAPIAPIEWFEGTPGSQTLAPDPAQRRLVVYPTHGSEHGGRAAGSPPPDILTYDPVADRWGMLGPAPIDWFAPDLTVGGGQVLVPMWDDPILDVTVDPGPNAKGH